MKLIHYRNPYEQEIERFNRLMNWALPFWGEGDPLRSNKPVVDFQENEDGYRMEVELPGFSKEQIQLDYHAGVLSLKAERVLPKDKDGNESRRVYERSIRLPDDIAPEKIEARMNNGVLEVSLPRREERKPNRIEIQ
jgi:HSP20 family protein